MKLLEEALNITRAKSEAKQADTHSSRRGRNPIGFLKGLFQTSRKDADMAVPHSIPTSDPAAVDAQESNTEAARNLSLIHI